MDTAIILAVVGFSIFGAGMLIRARLKAAYTVEAIWDDEVEDGLSEPYQEAFDRIVEEEQRR